MGTRARGWAFPVAAGYGSRTRTGKLIFMEEAMYRSLSRLTCVGALSAGAAFGAAHDASAPYHPPAARVPTRSGPLDDEGAFPGFAGASAWINSQPLTAEALKGKVVVVDFWTFACSNCLAALPHVKALAAEFHDQNVVVVGVHTPELAHERVEGNVRDAVRRLGVVYPVAIDGDYRIWRAFGNEYWPAVYIVDRNGRIRYHHFGEGAYDTQEEVVRELLREGSAG